MERWRRCWFVGCWLVCSFEGSLLRSLLFYLKLSYFLAFLMSLSLFLSLYLCNF